MVGRRYLTTVQLRKLSVNFKGHLYTIPYRNHQLISYKAENI